MADITCCAGTGCEMKESCYRYTASKNPHKQSVFISVPIDEETKECTEFWDNTGRK